MLYVSFGAFNSMVTLILSFELRPDQVQVKNVKFRKFKFSFKSMPMLSSFVWEFQKCYLFCRAAIRNSKSRASKSDVITTLGFWAIAHSQLKRRILAWNFVHLLVHSSITCRYSGFLDIYKNVDFLVIYFENPDFDFKGSKAKFYENPRQPFCWTCNLTPLGVCWLHFTLKVRHSRSIWMLAVFRPKIAWHDAIKTLFSQTSRRISMKFSLRTPNWRWIKYGKFSVDIWHRF